MVFLEALVCSEEDFITKKNILTCKSLVLFDGISVS